MRKLFRNSRPPAAVDLQRMFDQAQERHRAGRLDEATAVYREILTASPDHPDAMHLLGLAAYQAGRHEEAIDWIGRAIAIRPEAAEYHNHLGAAHAALGRFDAAAEAFGHAARVEPGAVEPALNLAHALRRSGNRDAAIAAYRRVIALRPDVAAAYNNLGSLLQEAGLPREAVESLQRAVELKPDSAEAHNNLGNVLLANGRIDEAIQSYRRAILLRPDLAELHNNLGRALREAGMAEEASAAFRQATAIRPDYADAKWNLSLMELLQGDFQRGTADYEARWNVSEFQSPRRGFTQPLWDGGDLNGRAILLHAEQGFGDTIQFVRYAPLVAQRGGRVILEVPPELHRLLAGMNGVERLVCAGEELPAFDVHCPLLSLPLAFRTGVKTIPADVPYLRVDQALAKTWGTKLIAPPGTLKVGLVWAGSGRHGNDRNRSLPPAAFAELARLPNITLFSLRKRSEGEPAETGDLPMIDRTDDLRDFADTAAMMAHLDWVVSVDTAAAHLAGALGRPVTTLLPFAPDWRWLLNRADSPWYPTMRLLRQARPGDWSEPLRLLVEEARRRGTGSV